VPEPVVPERVAAIFSAANEPVDLIRRVDQTWASVVANTRRVAAAQYVRSVEAVAAVVRSGLASEHPPSGRQGLSEALPAVSDLVTSGALAPITSPAEEPGLAVLRVMLVSVGATLRSLPFDITAGMPELAGNEIFLPQLSGQPTTPAAVTSGILQAISDVLTGMYEPPLETIRRVLEPRNDEELGRWLGVSRTTVADWSQHRFEPSASREKRLELVASIARMLDEYVHPEDLQGYLRSTELPAFADRTLADVLCEAGPEAAEQLSAADTLLRAALVQ
jgi:hypothetical protein